MMETRGFATVAIGLVRYQMEQVQPPRGLWTPFQLGRPLGEPEDAAFQRRVLIHALGLLERDDGPVILEDFPSDPPGWQDRADWRPPIHSPAPDAAPETPSAWAEQFAAELALIRPFWEKARARYGRTTVGLSGQEPDVWPNFTAAIQRGELPVASPHETAALSLRFLCDDIKALYSEAAQSIGPAPASRQIDTWFWESTVAGQLLIALRNVAVVSENNALKTVGSRFFVPTPFLPR
jgi:hypothetical protein